MGGIEIFSITPPRYTTMYYIFLKILGGIKIFFIPQPLIKIKFIFQIFGKYRSIFMPKMIHLLTFQSIKNILYFFKFGGYRNIFYAATSLHQKIVLGVYKNDVTEIFIYLLFNQLKMYCIFLNFGGV